jgi:hypothetical protein
MMRIEDGQPEEHPTPLPLDASHSPGAVAPTPRYPSGSAQLGAVTNTAGIDFEADARAAMSSGMAADGARRQYLLAAMTPLGGSAGDLMPLSSPPLDPGAGPGEALPAGGFYTPPRNY